MAQTFYSNGKLLLTGEYVVLDSAVSLALPTTYGQSMTVTKTDTPLLQWQSLNEKGEVWFSQDFEITDLQNEILYKDPVARTLLTILIEANRLNPDFLNNAIGYSVQTKLSFPRDWGLGSSSTLIDLIGQWAKVDSFALLRTSFGGSGYDIACAQSSSPLLYELRLGKSHVQKANFDPPFKEHLFFIHRNQKQNSREGIAQYRKNKQYKEESIRQISKISKNMLSCTTLVNFEALVEEHERLISILINTPTVKASLFADYQGSIKSLGAWGGDFILVTGKEKELAYFIEKGYTTIIPYAKMIL